MYRAKRTGEPWPPAPPAPPAWSKKCLMNATVSTYGYVGDISTVAGTFSLEFSILAPALVMSSVMIVNSTAMLMWVETGFVFCGLVVLLLTFADNARAVANVAPCMDRTFLSLNVLHMSILLGALLSAIGLLGHRSARGGSRWDDERGEWRHWMSFKMLKGPKQAKFNVKRVNVIVQGSANALASSAVQSLMPDCASRGRRRRGCWNRGRGSRSDGTKVFSARGWARPGSPAVEDYVQTLWMTVAMGRPPGPAHKKLASLHEEAEEAGMKRTETEDAFSSSSFSSFGKRLGKSFGESFGKSKGGKSFGRAPSRVFDAEREQRPARDVDVLMSLWRDGANRLMQARASAKLIEISDDGTLDWHSSAIPEHKIAFTARLG